MSGSAPGTIAAAWLNGRFVPAEEALIPLSDAGVQHGVGLFETMRAVHGRIFRAEAHLRRLEESARWLGLSSSIPVPALVLAAQQTIERAGLSDARVRVTVTGGTLNLLAPPLGAEPRLTIAITAQVVSPFNEAAFVLGVGVALAEPRISPTDPFAGHKTLSYWPRLAVLRRAAEAGFDEALWCDTNGGLVGATVGNAFVVRNGRIATPRAWSGSMPAPTLPGITRAAIIEIARAEGIEVDTRPIDRGDLERAEEIFLTNSMWGVLPVTRLLDRPVGGGSPGPVTRCIRERFTDLLESETRG